MSKILLKISNASIGVVCLPSRNSLKNNTWDIKCRDRLEGIIAFVKWSIPQNKAFMNCYKLTFMLGVNPTLGSDMSYMFYGATSFNQPLNFDTSSVINMSCMFEEASSFNQRVNFDTSSVTDISNIFRGSAMTQENIALFQIHS